MQEINIHTLYAQAKRVLLRDGWHTPLVLIVTSNDRYMTPPHTETFESGDGPTKAQGFFLIGLSIAEQEHEKAEDVEMLFFITEGYYAETTKEERKTGNIKKASEHANKKEVLMVEEYRPKDNTRLIHVAEIIRRGGTVDLLPINTESMGFQSLFLPGVIEGMKSVGLPEEVIKQRLEKMVVTGSWE